MRERIYWLAFFLAAIGLVVVLLVRGAKADDDETRQTWPERGEITRCVGVLTSNNVCIGSESFVDQPDDHAPIDGAVIVVHPNRRDKD